MDVNIITMPRAEARTAFKNYRAAVRGERGKYSAKWKKEDAALMRAYKAAAQGARIIDILQVMKVAGVRQTTRQVVNNNGIYYTLTEAFPKFAIARSDAKKIWCHVSTDGSVRFNADNRYASRKADSFRLPARTLPVYVWDQNRRSEAETLVPIVPPQLRPRFDLSGYHTFWEVEKWDIVPPRDPMLLKHLGGWLYAVLATWDLTELERAVLGAPARA